MMTCRIWPKPSDCEAPRIPHQWSLLIFTRLFSYSGLHSHPMKALITVFFLLILWGCGGSPKTAVRPIASNATPTPTPFPTPTPVTDQITITADSVLNMGMIGQTWTFQNALGMTNTFTIESAPPVAACRDGNNLVIHMTKTDKDTYWLLGADQAEILFLLHQNPDGSWRSTASLINEPLGSTFNGPLVATYDVIDNQPGMPMPYMIAPPDTATGDNFINETRATSIGGDSLTFSCEIPAGFPLTGPNDGGYFRTDFYLAQVRTPLYSGAAIVSDQYEGACGHERWYFAPGLGIVEIESLNDGGETKLNPICGSFSQHQFSNPEHTIKRVS